MADKHKDITQRIYTEQVRSGDPEAKERGIRDKHSAGDSGDWRNPDTVLDLSAGWRVRSRDTAVEGHEGNAPIEPRWSEFDTFLLNNATGQEINLGRNPAAFFKQAWKEGRVIYGNLVGRDESRHN